MSLNTTVINYKKIYTDKTETKHSIEIAKNEIESADAIIIGAGAGLSASAGFTYSGKRFEDNFPDFINKYGFKDMYSAGFYPYKTLEEYWAYWSRYIFINRYQDAPKNVYNNLYSLVQDKDYFVLTTNVDHCFQKAGFDKNRLFYTQGDYGLFQCSKPCHQNTYDNETIIRKMVEAHGYVIDMDGTLFLPKGVSHKMTIPPDLVPHCPKCGKPMSMNLRADHTFAENEGWHFASGRYAEFLRRHQNMKVIFLEAAVGFNTPAIIKYSFWCMVREWKDAGCLGRFTFIDGRPFLYKDLIFQTEGDAKSYITYELHMCLPPIYRTCYSRNQSILLMSSSPPIDIIQHFFS